MPFFISLSFIIDLLGLTIYYSEGPWDVFLPPLSLNECTLTSSFLSLSFKLLATFKKTSYKVVILIPYYTNFSVSFLLSSSLNMSGKLETLIRGNWMDKSVAISLRISAPGTCFLMRLMIGVELVSGPYLVKVIE